MEFSALTAFVAVAEQGSFSQAAQALYLTQPAVSKRISSLEHELDTRLFDRLGRQIALTEAGRALLPRAIELLQSADELQRLVASLSAEVAGPLLMATSHHIGLHRLPDILRSYNHAYPKVQLDIRFMDSEAACRAVEAGEIELAIVTLPIEPPPNLTLEAVWDDPLAFFVGRGHVLAEVENPSLEQVLSHPAVLPGPATYTRAILARAVAGSGLELQVAMSTNYLETLKMLVAANLGWSLLPATMADAGIIPLPLDLTLNRQLGLVTHRSRTLSNPARAMARSCRNCAGD